MYPSPDFVFFFGEFFFPEYFRQKISERATLLWLHLKPLKLLFISYMLYLLAVKKVYLVQLSFHDIGVFDKD